MVDDHTLLHALIDVDKKYVLMLILFEGGEWFLVCIL